MPMNLAAAAEQVGRIVEAGGSGNTQVDAGFLQADCKDQTFVATIKAISQLFAFRSLNSLGKDLADDLARPQGQGPSLRAEGPQEVLQRFGLEECSHGCCRSVIEEAAPLYTLSCDHEEQTDPKPATPRSRVASYTR